MPNPFASNEILGSWKSDGHGFELAQERKFKQSQTSELNFKKTEMTVRLELLRTFVTVARAGELAQAANTLGRTPSAISMALKQLQDELGTALFETDRKTKLTKIGSIIFAEAERAVISFDHSVATLMHHARSEVGYIRIAAVPSIATTLMPLAINKLRIAMPGIRIDMQDMDSRSVVNEILAERIDVGLASLGEPRHGVEATLLWEDRFEVVLPVNHRLAKAKSVQVKDIAGETFISNGLCELIDHSDVRKLLLSSSIAVRNTTSLLSMVRKGLGVTLLPRMMETQLISGITFVPLSGIHATRRLYTLVASGARPSIAITSFLEILHEIADENRTKTHKR